MSKLLDLPVMVLVVTFLILWISTQAGALITGRVRPVKEEERGYLDLVVGSSLTLLALIIGFSFSMAVSRYDQRKNYEEEEANAIGTEYVRAGLLNPVDTRDLRLLLSSYLDQRILFYTVSDPIRLKTIDRETLRLQDSMWNAVQSAAAQAPTPPMVLVIAGMNDVLNRQGYTQAAWWNRIPTGAWDLMFALSICCSFLVGYTAHQRWSTLYTVLPFLLALAFFLMSDIDCPRGGIIRVAPQNLISLSGSIQK